MQGEGEVLVRPQGASASPGAARQGPGWACAQWAPSGMWECSPAAPSCCGQHPTRHPCSPPEGTASQARLGAAYGSKRLSGTQPQLQLLINCMAPGESPPLLACFLLCTLLITIQPSEPEIRPSSCVYTF